MEAYSETPPVQSINYVKLAPGWALIGANFDPIQKNGPKVGSGHCFARPRYVYLLFHIKQHINQRAQQLPQRVKRLASKSEKISKEFSFDIDIGFQQLSFSMNTD